MEPGATLAARPERLPDREAGVLTCSTMSFQIKRAEAPKYESVKIKLSAADAELARRLATESEVSVDEVLTQAVAFALRSAKRGAKAKTGKG